MQNTTGLYNNTHKTIDTDSTKSSSILILTIYYIFFSDENTEDTPLGSAHHY